MERGRYQTLLPAPGQETGEVRAQKRKRENRLIACNNCRTKKVACDGQEPACGPCVKRKIECVYRQSRLVDTEVIYTLTAQRDALRKKLSDHVALIGHLTSLPETEATELVRRLRSTSNPNAVMESMRGSVHTLQRPSDHRAVRGIVPPTDSHLEFELTAQYPMVYSKLEPLNLAFLDAFVNSTVLGKEYRLPDLQTPPQLDLAPAVSLDSSTPSSTPPLSSSSLSATSSEASLPSPPQQATAFCDPRLDRLQIGFWTKVPISDELAAATISFYLENDHPIMGVFDPDLFLTDLTEHRLTFCSPFLVSSLLHLSCQSYARVDPNSSALVSQFFHEAMTLWKSEQNSDSIMAVAAAELMSLGCQCNGQDQVGTGFLEAGRRMAERLNLLDVPPGSPRLQVFGTMSPQWIKAASYVAWGTHNWLSLHGFYFHDPPILYPPSLPVPGEKVLDLEAAGQRTERWQDPILLPAYMGQTFPAMCRFWAIVQEITTAFFGPDGKPISGRVPIAFVEAEYQKLLAWTETIPEGMRRGERSPGHALIFHMLFHCIVVQMFHPFLQLSSGLSFHKMRSFVSGDGCPVAVFAASLKQLKRLLYLFQTQCPSTTWSIFLNPALIQVGDAMLSLQSRHDPGTRLYFLLCIRAWLDLYTSYPIFWDLVKGFLARALRDDVMGGAEAKRLMTELLRRGVHHKVPEHAVSSIIMDFDLAVTDPEIARVRAIAERFEELALHDEFTTGIYNVEGDEADTTTKEPPTSETGG